MIEEWFGLSTSVSDTQEALREARDALAEGRTDAAFAIYRALLVTDGLSTTHEAVQLDALLGLGVCHARRKEWEEALIAFSDLCDRAPTFAPAWAFTGATRFELGEIDDALSNLDTAVTCDPESAIARIKRAEVRLSLGLLDAAEEDLRVAARAATDESIRTYARDLLMSVLRLKKRAVNLAKTSPGDALRGFIRLARGFARHD